jgi:hypothetical protein
MLLHSSDLLRCQYQDSPTHTVRAHPHILADDISKVRQNLMIEQLLDEHVATLSQA